MSHSAQAALGKLAKSHQSGQLLKDWNKTIQELGKYNFHLNVLLSLTKSHQSGQLLKDWNKAIQELGKYKL
jgi:hypothetical protein